MKKTYMLTFPLENTSVHLSISSGDTLRLERSIYPLSLSTLMTTTGSVRPTRINLLIDLIRLLLNSLNNIIPTESNDFRLLCNDIPFIIPLDTDN